MPGRGRLVQAYRTAEDYRRYTLDSPDRRAALKRLVAHHRRYIGRSVLDLACGGGVLGAVLAPSGREYLGVDVNPDMLREARKIPGLRVLEADITGDRIPGRFDTVTLLGNAMAHFPIADMDRLLTSRGANVRPGSTFVVDYQDLVAMFWHGTWPRVRVTTHIRGKITHRVRKVDLEKGTLDLRARPSTRAWVTDWSHAVWSPFILEPLMRHHGWLLVERSTPKSRAAGASKAPEYHIDVYRLEATRA